MPARKPAIFEFKKERIEHWMKNGALPSDTVARLLGKNGVKGLEAYTKRYTKQKSKSAVEEAPPTPAPKAAAPAAAPVAEAPAPEAKAEELVPEETPGDKQ